MKLSVTTKELLGLSDKLKKIAVNTDALSKYSLYDAAGLAVASIAKGISGLRVVSDVASIHAWEARTPTRICYTQRECLYNSLGLTPMKKRDGNWSIKAGFDNKDPVTGYNTIQTRRWPKGQPNIMIAASCEHGSTAMIEQPFIRPAFTANRSEMQRLMIESSQQWIQDMAKFGRVRRRSGRRYSEYADWHPIWGEKGKLLGWETENGIVPNAPDYRFRHR